MSRSPDLWASPLSASESVVFTRLSVRGRCTVFALSFGLCLTLGFSGLARYDPRQVKGLSDSRSYAAMATSGVEVSKVHELRVLVPAAARPLARVLTGRIGSWSPQFTALLVINATFIAWAALLLGELATKVSADPVAGIVAPLLYLLTFNVSVLYLAGLVDSVETWGIIAAVYVMMKRRWNMLPLVAFVAALGKETSIVLLIALTLGWLVYQRANLGKARNVTIVLTLIASQIIALAVAEWTVSGHLSVPSQISLLVGDPTPPALRLSTLVNHEWIYAFFWLFPLGVLRLGRLPREWRAGSVAALFAAIIPAFVVGVGGNVVRPAFNAVAPMLIVSATIALTELMRARGRDLASGRD
jgi:hypothetical protein